MKSEHMTHMTGERLPVGKRGPTPNRYSPHIGAKQRGKYPPNMPLHGPAGGFATGGVVKPGKWIMGEVS